MTTELQIEEILLEASAYGLRIDVLNLAIKLHEDGYPKLESYEMAYSHYIN